MNPFFSLDRFGVDTMRFFLAYQGGLAGDADYDNSYIIRDYKKLLQSGIGNLVLRTIGSSKGKLHSYIVSGTSGELPAANEQDLQFEQLLRETPVKVGEQMESLNPRAALQNIMVLIEQVR